MMTCGQCGGEIGVDRSVYRLGSRGPDFCSMACAVEWARYPVNAAAINENEMAMVDRAQDAHVTLSLDGVLLIREEHIPAKELRFAVDELLTRMGRRKVSIALTTLEPLSAEEWVKVDSDIDALRAAFGAGRGEPMEEAARRILRVYVNWSGRMPTARDAVIEAAMVVCRPGPGWSVEEACAVLRRGDLP